MAVSKRLRYEVLSRDGYACRYCGRHAPATPLTVDHVMPRTLGGHDELGNLVTACTDCNAGKSSSRPAESLVASVKRSQVEWEMRHYKEAVHLLFGALPDFEGEDSVARFAAKFDVDHAEDEDPSGQLVEYKWPTEIKAFVAAVEAVAEDAWYSLNSVYKALCEIAGQDVDEALEQARDEYRSHGLEPTDRELERRALHVAIEWARARSSH